MASASIKWNVSNRQAFHFCYLSSAGVTYDRLVQDFPISIDHSCDSRVGSSNQRSSRLDGTKGTGYQVLLKLTGIMKPSVIGDVDKEVERFYGLDLCGRWR